MSNLKSYKIFTGNWKVTGENLSDAPNSVEVEFSGTQIVEFLEGKKYIKAEWKYDYENDEKFYGISLIGENQQNSNIECDNFDNLGFHRIYECQMDGKVWQITGETEKANIKFSEDGNSYDEYWEVKIDGKWKPLCKRNGEKIQ